MPAHPRTLYPKEASLGDDVTRPRFYSCDVEADRSVQEIMQLLSKHGSEDQHLYRTGGQPAGIGFTIDHPAVGQVAVKLEPDVEAIENRLEQTKPHPTTPSDPLDIAWRLVKWTVEVRLEMVANAQATMFEAFLPDVMTAQGDTVGEVLTTRPEMLLDGQETLRLPGS